MKALRWCCVWLLTGLVLVAFGVFWVYAKLTDRMDRRKRSAS